MKLMIVPESMDEARETLKRDGRLYVRACSICGYECGYVLLDGALHYDSGCYCVYAPPSPREWSSIEWWIAMNHRPKESGGG